jgi:HEAT repeat protein
MNTKTSESLIHEAYIENDEEVYWSLIAELHKRGTVNEFNLSVKLCKSDDPIDREIGADILGQLGWQQKAFQEESISILIDLLSDPIDDVITSAAYALGHRNSFEAIKPLLGHKNHPNSRVRYSVVFGLLGLEDTEAISCLIELSEDKDDEVRNWATFGLGSQIDVNTGDIRDALEKRLTDSVSEIRGEAFVGLATRGCNSIIDVLIKELNGDDIGVLMLEAAEILSSPSLYSPLKTIQNALKDDDSDYFISRLSEALDSCSKSCKNKP